MTDCFDESAKYVKLCTKIHTKVDLHVGRYQNSCDYFLRRTVENREEIFGQTIDSKQSRFHREFNVLRVKCTQRQYVLNSQPAPNPNGTSQSTLL